MHGTTEYLSARNFRVSLRARKSLEELPLLFLRYPYGITNCCLCGYYAYCKLHFVFENPKRWSKGAITVRFRFWPDYLNDQAVTITSQRVLSRSINRGLYGHIVLLEQSNRNRRRFSCALTYVYESGQLYRRLGAFSLRV